MISHQHKKKSRLWIFAPQVLVFAAVVIFVLWTPTRNFLKLWSFKLADFLAPEHRELERSRDQIWMLERIAELQAENKKLNELLGEKSEKKILLAKLSFGGGYLFTDIYFLKDVDGQFKIGDLVLKDGILLGRISEAGEGWSKFKSLGGLGEKSVLRAGTNKEIVIEAVGRGGGELVAEIPASIVVHVGDPVWWGGRSRILGWDYREHK